MTQNEFNTMLGKAWNYWKVERDYIPVYGFKEWMMKEFNVIYSPTSHEFLNDRGKLMFIMRWG